MDYLKELLAFPGSKFDDQVGLTTQALEYFTRVLRKLTIPMVSFAISVSTLP